MFSVATKGLGALASSLIKSQSNALESAIEEKIVSLGKDLISDIIRSSPLGIGISVIQKLGAVEFKRMRDAWLNTLQPVSPSSGMLGRISNSFQQIAAGAEPQKDGKWTWSKSRREWLDESWKHNWRSQPRDRRGRWIKGRLKTIYVSTSARKSRSARRRAIRKSVKEIFRGN